ncbi:MAG TPA: LutB/LldF family L-lactate oxidation iron-sulfur protein [Geminicoccus sp.]|uniref:LutB/LldF family L-lactate oxidation iron-sulfur protein n=1 Tax=Geminicoccus sp. TaxID=2024832 RepID=UPI002CD1731F|nr:LutB/LldF family L-lactate oxidation iron-sulfur protein [Geminicoccus sp.]HWL69020.1 LutB/LldF family L-lactate oxidation iron-sulfur protein [Geminicoccus sp.]
MQPTSLAFQSKAAAALADPNLQTALGGIKTGWQRGRILAADRLPEFEQLRDQARDIKNHALANLDFYLEAFEARVLDAGGQVHWARDAAEARRIIQEICESAGAKTVTKSKSMIAEEIGLNDHLEAAGITPVETDLGEYIIQLRKEPPSHLVGPAVHLTKDQVADLFEQTHGLPRTDDPTELVGQARTVLRQKYLQADVGITGANFLIAETGSAITVTNEGNAELTQGLPKVHVVIASLEKVIPSMEDAFTLLRVLARSATGQEFSAYTTVMTGPKRQGDLDGPEQFHVVLLDNGRTGMIGSKFQDMLRCIRCGACMNNCPVYLAAGGHAYGWVYVGPMGSVLTPQFVGIESAHTLPNASTFCGRCEEVCPVRIPLPNLMRHWREEQFKRQLVPSTVRYGLGTWGFFARRPALYRLATRLAMGVLGRLGKKRGRFASLPLAEGWTVSRDLPAPQGRTFMQQWRQRQRSRP